ncbi:dihydropteroate synthase [Roseinatronobacter thiooxidans]|uniref:Dihydropteroate synthase n=1 Tax=Roseinatronobacter thiooxidans TaxID=121821 RepID=A0A2W7R9N2_9RHOB|nr:dihydropteroate synthase [Roseinatronobacter thiooxidans]
MKYLLPLLRPAALASPEMPALRGQKAVRLAAIAEINRDGGWAERAFCRTQDAGLLAELPPLCGLDLARPRIMGILNVTPDSFSDGGQFHSFERACAQAHRMVAEGADILDIGGESTRPGAQEVPVAEEIARTAPLIAALRADGLRVPISIDTRKARVAAAALAAGADLVNDVSALTWDRDMGRVVAEAGVPLCLMHAQGTPQTMQNDPKYNDVRLDVYDWLAQAVTRAEAAGIDRSKVIVDPGIGFGKTLEHNLALLQSLALLHQLGCAILLGASRKRFIGTLCGVEVASHRMAGSVAAALFGAGQGAQILRVHDVIETRQALAVGQALEKTVNGVKV